MLEALGVNESIIVAASFFLFIALVYQGVKKGVIAIIDDYAAEAVKSLKESQKMRDEAHKLLTSVKKQQIEAKKTSAEIISRSKAEAEAIQKDAKSEIKKLAIKKLEMAYSRIEQQEKQILEGMKNEAVQMAISQVQEALIDELDSSAQLTLIHDGVRGIKKLVH